MGCDGALQYILASANTWARKRDLKIPYFGHSWFSRQTQASLLPQATCAQKSGGGAQWHACTFACKNHEGTSCCQFADISQHQISDAFMPGHAPSHYISGFRGVRAGIHSQAIPISQYTCMGERGFGASQDRHVSERNPRSACACARRMLASQKNHKLEALFNTSPHLLRILLQGGPHLPQMVPRPKCAR